MSRRRDRIDWHAVRVVLARDLGAIKRSKALVLPMLFLPVVLFILLPMSLGIAANGKRLDISRFIDFLPTELAKPILTYPPHEQLVILVLGYLVAPLFLIVPLMVSAVTASDTFAGEKERRTLESLLHLPVEERDLFVSKVLFAFIPTVIASWVGFVLYAVSVNVVAWPVMGRIFVPTWRWVFMIGFLAPAVAALGLGIMVRVSARARTTQEANQLGGAVIMPLILVSVGQASGIAILGKHFVQFEALFFSPHDVHPVEHRGPITGFRAARACIYGQNTGQFVLRFVQSRAEFRVGQHFVALFILCIDLGFFGHPFFLEIKKHFQVIHFAFQDQIGVHPTFVDFYLAHDAFCAFGVVPKVGVVTQLFFIFKLALSVGDVKDTPLPPRGVLANFLAVQPSCC